MKDRFMTDALSVYICDGRTELGRLSAKAVYDKINELFKMKEEINLLFAAARLKDSAKLLTGGEIR